jgi:hypothetical protein
MTLIVVDVLSTVVLLLFSRPRGFDQQKIDYSSPPQRVLRRWFIMRITLPLNLAAPAPVATILLVVGVVLAPLGSARRNRAGRRAASALP